MAYFIWGDSIDVLEKVEIVLGDEGRLLLRPLPKEVVGEKMPE
jgi:hypothetical protein